MLATANTNDFSRGEREAWTSSPDSASLHVIDNFTVLEKDEILRLWKMMSKGGEGDPIEPWGPSIRAIVYPDWLDTDFLHAIESVSRQYDIASASRN